MVKSKGSGARLSGLNLGSIIYKLCDLVQVTSLCLSIFLLEMEMIVIITAPTSESYCED